MQTMQRLKPPRALVNCTPAALKQHLSQAEPPPVLLPGLIAHYRALKAWTVHNELERFRLVVPAEREVDVEIGPVRRGYLDPQHARVPMGFGLFLDAFILGKIPSTTGAELPIGYLAQSDLLDSIPALAEDAPALPHLNQGPQGEFWRRTLWLGPSGTFTPFHKDPYHGLFSQIHGSKRFNLLPPRQGENLHLNNTLPHSNTSRIPAPPHEPLSEAMRHSLDYAFKDEMAFQVTLHPGDSLVVPEGWWHCAEGLQGVGIGVGGWFR